MSSSLDLEWSDGLNGGYLSPANPQAILTVPSAGTGLTTVRLAMVRADASLKTGLILAVCRGDKLLTAKPTDANIVTKSKYLSSASVTINAELQGGTYVVLCCEGKPVDGNKKFTLSADAGSLTVPKFNGCTLKHTLAMAGEGAAGYGASKNPQFFLEVTKKTAAMLTFEAEQPPAGSAGAPDADGQGKSAVCFWVQRSPKGTACRIDDFPTGAGRVFTSPYTSGNVVSGSVPDLAPGVYVVLVMKSLKTPSTCNLTVKTVDDPDTKISGAAFQPVVRKEVPCSEVVAGAAKAPDMVKVKESLPKACAFYDHDVAKALVDKINATLKTGSEVFLDAAFPHEAGSINNVPAIDKKLTEAACWRRPAELVSEPALFTDGASADDIAQGSLGNCWFCATVSAIGGFRPDVASRMFYPAQYNPKGVYAVTMYVDGVKKALIIDDALPARQGGSALAFAHSSDKTEFWFSLVEKAFAKVVGGYQALMGRAGLLSSVPVMAMMTGGVGETLALGKGGDDDDDANWAKAAEYASKKWLVTTGTREAPSKESGLVAAHAYTVLNAVEVDGQRLVHCRNTWGRSEWTGDWSDASDLWRAHPNVAKTCGVDPDRPEDDGNFWMAWSDFVANFSGLNLCKFVEDDFPHKAGYKGSFVAAERMDFKNPMQCDQLYVDLDQPGASLSVQLSCTAKACRFQLWAAPADGKTTRRMDGMQLFTSPYSSKARGEVQLPADCKRCILIPSAYAAPSDYSIAVHSTCHLKLAVAEAAAPCELSVKWPAGGCKYQAAPCPTVQVTVPEGSGPVPLAITLKLPADYAKQGMKMALADGGPAGPNTPWPKACVAESKFSTTLLLTLKVPDVAPGTYTLRLTTHKPADTTAALTIVAPIAVTAKQLEP